MDIIYSFTRIPIHQEIQQYILLQFTSTGFSAKHVHFNMSQM